MRILVTGSRGWADTLLLKVQLFRAAYGTSSDRRGRHTIVSGACPTGADRMAEEAAANWGWQIERHPADWDTHGRSAGPLRNAEMVALGADVCLAFISDCTSPRCNKPGRHPSHGASHTADLAESAGIPTCRFSEGGVWL